MSDKHQQYFWKYTQQLELEDNELANLKFLVQFLPDNFRKNVGDDGFSTYEIIYYGYENDGYVQPDGDFKLVIRNGDKVIDLYGTIFDGQIQDNYHYDINIISDRSSIMASY